MATDFHLVMVAPTNFFVPPRSYGGEVFIHTIIKGLERLYSNIRITLLAVHGSYHSDKTTLLPIRCSYNDWREMVRVEDELTRDREVLRTVLDCDAIHDFSHRKTLHDFLRWRYGRRNSLCTLWGSTWDRPLWRENIVVWSQAHHDMGVRGDTGFEGSGVEQLGQRSGSIPSAKIVQGGVDTELYTPGGEVGGYILFMSRPHPAKGVDVALEVARLNPGVEFRFAWDATTSRDHQAYEDALLPSLQGLPNCRLIRLPQENHHEHKRGLLRGARALLMPVRYSECWGIVIAEAMACGTPVIGSRRGALPELIRPWENGLLCGGLEEFSQAIRNIEDVSRERTRRYAVDHFSAERVARDYMQLYEGVRSGAVW